MPLPSWRGFDRRFAPLPIALCGVTTDAGQFHAAETGAAGRGSYRLMCHGSRSSLVGADRGRRSRRDLRVRWRRCNGGVPPWMGPGLSRLQAGRSAPDRAGCAVYAPAMPSFGGTADLPPRRMSIAGVGQTLRRFPAGATPPSHNLPRSGGASTGDGLQLGKRCGGGAG